MSMFRRGDDSDSDDEDQLGAGAVPGGLVDDLAASAPQIESKDTSEDGDEEIGLFGNLHELDESLPITSGPSGSTATPSSSTLVSIREFPLPKHVPSSMALPKRLLSDVLSSSGSTNAERAAAKAKAREVHPVIEFRDICGGSRAKRVELDIFWVKSDSVQKHKASGKGTSKSKSNGGAGRPPSALAKAASALWPDEGPSPVVFSKKKGASVASTPLNGSTAASGVSTPMDSTGPDDNADDVGEAKPVSAPLPAAARQPSPAAGRHSANVVHSLTYAMHSIGCPSLAEAEHYLATIALHQLTTRTVHEGSKDLGLQPPPSLETKDDGTAAHASSPLERLVPLPSYPAINPKLLPLVYRDLWDELEVVRLQREHESSRKVWSTLEDIVNKQAAGSAESGVASGQRTPLVDRSDAVEKSRTAGGGDFDRLQAPKISQRIKDDWDKRSRSRAYQDMLSQRNSLPIAAFRQEIVETIRDNQVMILSGETGCGKSTQLPSFILESCLAKGQDCKIYVTEPRRISAISLAQRVSKELGDAGAGKNDGLVGYSIRLENNIGPNTKLAFVTNGIALRMLEAGSDNEEKGRGSAFDQVTHIIIDEVHERSIDSDFLLIVLRSLMQVRRDLKVILMSATLDAEKLSAYFGGCPVLAVPGRTFPVKVAYLEDAVQFSGYELDPSSPFAIRARDQRSGRFSTLEWTEDIDEDLEDSDSASQKTSDPLKMSSTLYSKQTIDTVNLLDPRQIPYDLVVRILERLCFESAEHADYSHAVLIFLPGLQEIRKMHDALVDHDVFGNPNAFRLFPLHSTISSEGQSAVFDIPPQGVRKIVMATNIAETGITIPDITAVIDSGKHREMKYDEKRQISRLTETYIARSNATQRRGRAGRVQEGIAFHLFTRARFEHQMAPHPLPEMLRLSLQDLALRIKILRVKLGSTIAEALASALDPPAPLNVMRAVNSLVEVGALTSSDESITPLGRLLSRLPVDVHLGKFLLYAALFGCLDPALTIAATLNAKSPFVTPFGQEQAADTVKASFKTGNSDFLTLHNVYTIWKKMSTHPNTVRTWCRKNFLSQQTLGQIEELRQQLYSYLVETSFIKVTDQQREDINRARFSRGWKTQFLELPSDLNVNADDGAMVNAALAAGLYPKLLVVDLSTGGLKTLTNNQAISVHPSSVNFRMKTSEFASNYVVYFTIMQSKRLYAWETGPVTDLAVFLLCGEVVDYKLWASSTTIDRKLRFEVHPRSLLALKSLREGFASAVAQRMRGRTMNAEQGRWWELGMRCLRTPDKEEREVTMERIGVQL